MKKNSQICSPWEITETNFSKENNYKNETIFTLGNGYIGTRGTFEENYNFGDQNGMEGNFINGFYESEPIRYGEFNYGFPQKSQTMLNVTNPKILRLIVDQEEFLMTDCNVKNYHRTLSLKEGILSRECIWETSSGKQMRICIERLVSFEYKHLMSIKYQIEPLNFSGTIRLISQIETDVCNHTAETNPLIDYGPYGKSLFTQEAEISDDKTALTLLSQVKNNQFWLFTGCLHIFDSHTKYRPALQDTSNHLLTLGFDLDVKKGQNAVITKQIIYTTHEKNREICKNEGHALLLETSSLSFDFLKKKQKKFLDTFWTKSDVEIIGDNSAQQGIRFNLFHILQATGRDGMTSIGAKGLSGEGYEGHCFWDTEMYIIPFYTHTYPELSRNLLLYRYHHLNEARKQALLLGHKKGALYPWRTINGNDASAYFLLGSAQYHINSDIAYAVNQYVAISGDTDFMYNYGLEMLCEISRIFADVGHFSEYRDGKYVINCVTGPDEYTALVDNNFYTNLGARETLKATLYWLQEMKTKAPEKHTALTKKLSLTKNEENLWLRIIDNMYFGRDNKLGIYTQDDTFMQKKPWDSFTDKEKKQKHLYLNFHPLYVFRHQMCKQADTPLGLLLYNHLFSKEEIQRNYEFYEPRTLNLSSLSLCIFAIIESLLGKYEAAYNNFVTSARTDLDDYYHNVSSGIHAANMAGTWMTLTYGLAGLNTTDGKLHFSPHLPKKWDGYAFRITYHENSLHISITRSGTTYTLEKGEHISFTHNGEYYHLTTANPQLTLL